MVQFSFIIIYLLCNYVNIIGPWYKLKYRPVSFFAHEIKETTNRGKTFDLP